jgi:hypothetical protein
MWAEPDMSVLRLNRRPPPALPLEVFGQEWAEWISQTADAAGAPPDYVAAPLLASASALIGNARWPEVTRTGWREPPHLWVGVVGDSGTSKSPGADCLLRDVLPEIERRMLGDFPDRHREWQGVAEVANARRETWEQEVRKAQKNNNPPPDPPAGNFVPSEPQAPRLRQSDATVEKVAQLLASAAPKGLLIVRDELAGWLLGMTAYNDAGRPFWIEAYGGRPYRVERVKHPEPIMVERLAVAVTGGTQPEKLAEIFREADDGLLARICWVWPDLLPYDMGSQPPAADWAVGALDRLRLLDLAPGEDGKPPHPVCVPLADEAVAMMREFGRTMQNRQQDAGGLMRSAYGKARGLALRLSLVLEFLWWCGQPGMAAPPGEVSPRAFAAACALVTGYLIPMAERVYGDAAASTVDRNAATLARWIDRNRPREVHVRTLLRDVRLPGLAKAEAIHAAADALVEAGWLRPPGKGSFQARGKAAYAVNPALGAMQ